MLKKVLLLGSGGLRIGQAGEFDYSGSQALKALKEEGVKTVLVNPNVATVQTDAGMADRVYLQPLRLDIVTKIIAKEKPDGILLGFGGQTALNLGLALDQTKILQKYKVRVLGTPIKAIRLTEDRDLFKQALEKINVKTPRSFAVSAVNTALSAAKKIGYPVMLRSGFSLGGLGSGKIETEAELKQRAAESLSGAPQILIEEYLGGWKEIEYEIVRDSRDTAITVCNMENLDPMGVHTGESIVVAPSQTLSNEEYHRLRAVAIQVARAVGIVGECNIQYALNPDNGDYRVIEMNARLSRSSALASKATGYPLAFVAAKIALGKKLHELRNAVTKKTSACFEPALDYLVVKIPSWDLTKFSTAERLIGSEMKSVGEVMAIGRSFPETIQKAVRMLNIGATGLGDYPHDIPDPDTEIKKPTDRRLFAIYQALRRGESVDKIHEWSKIDRWFLNHLQAIAQVEKQIQRAKKLDVALLRTAKEFGFSDQQIAKLTKQTETTVRARREQAKIVPVIKQIDTLAGEFTAATNYLYSTYHGRANDIKPSVKKPYLIIGSGPYCIGSSVEFDWCSVNTARTMRKLGESPIIINSNPETVSTDYDESDRLYFEELTEERVRDIADFENARALVVSVGGQIANSLAKPLAAAGYQLLGTKADAIDQAENRQRFSALLNKLKIDQPDWQEVTTLAAAKKFAASGGYPLIIRPSYILSGTAMNVVYAENELEKYLAAATVVSREHPVVMSRFILGAKELELDGVAKNGQVVVEAISEHVENAGVHSGDATVALPPQRLYLETVRRTKQIAHEIIKALKITGPFNFQFLAKNNEIKVIECNLRASRSFPFVSKVTNVNLIKVAVETMLGKLKPEIYSTLDLPYVGVKTSQFSYQRIKGSDPVQGVEMASTGEVACLGRTYEEAFFLSWLATEQNLAGKNILLSISDSKKEKLLDVITKIDNTGWNIFATEGTHDFLSRHGIASVFLYKASVSSEPSVLSAIAEKKVDLIINIPRGPGKDTSTDGYAIRRAAVSHHLPVITNAQVAKLFLNCLADSTLLKKEPLSWQEFINQLRH